MLRAEELALLPAVLWKCKCTAGTLRRADPPAPPAACRLAAGPPPAEEEDPGSGARRPDPGRRGSRDEEEDDIAAPRLCEARSSPKSEMSSSSSSSSSSDGVDAVEGVEGVAGVEGVDGVDPDGNVGSTNVIRDARRGSPALPGSDDAVDETSIGADEGMPDDRSAWTLPREELGKAIRLGGR